MNTLPSTSNRIAVLQRTGGVWRGLIASLPETRPSILSTNVFENLDSGQLNDWLDRNDVQSVLCVLPASCVVCRNCSLPDASTAQLEQALRLQAETHVAGIAPPHRMAVAVLPAAPEETTRSGIVFAWPESAEFNIPSVSKPVTFVPDIASLAALLNDSRPADPILWLDRADGTIALAITHANGATFRATREEGSTTENWSKSVGKVFAETALNEGHTGPFVESVISNINARTATFGEKGSALIIPNELIRAACDRILGAKTDKEWWSEYGVLVGAVLARTGPLASTTQLNHTPPTEAPPAYAAAVEKLSQPRTAAMAALICAGLLLIGPFVVSGLRLKILELKHADIDSHHEAALEVKDKLAIYREMQKQNMWPMTKLLADISNNTPLGIELDSIRIESGKDISVSGTAIANEGRTATEVVALMQENLREESMFNDIVVKWGSASRYQIYEFDLSAKVVRPYKIAKYPIDRDFGTLTYAQRLYEDKDTVQPASSRTPQIPDNDLSEATVIEDAQQDLLANADDATPDQPEESTEPKERVASTNRRTNPQRSSRFRGRDDMYSTSSAANPTESLDRPVTKSMEIPAKLSEEEIRTMSLAEVRAAMVKVSEARKHVDAESEDGLRLKDEFYRLLQRIKDLNTRS